MRARTTRITGIGVEVPPRVVSSSEVEALVGIARFGFAPGWLERVTGVRERHWADPEVRPSDLATAAGHAALDDAGVPASAIDAIIFCGITRDFIEPATANVVQSGLSAGNARVFDVTNACNGIVDGIDVADALIVAGKAERVLIVTGERASIAVGWRPRTREDFMRAVAGLVVGDTGGGLVLEASADPDRGIMAREYRSDGTHWSLATGGRFRPTTQACEICGSVVDLAFECDGRAIFEVGFAMMPPTMEAVMSKTGWSYDMLDVVFCHEASKRFVDAGMGQLGAGSHPGPKLWSTVERYGNTSTASLPLAMQEARDAGALRAGARVLALGGAAGVSMAALTMVW